MSVTYHAKNRRRSRRHGFLKRMSTKAGTNIINNRRKKGRKRITVNVSC